MKVSLANTLRLVPEVFWIVVEDGNTTSAAVKTLLIESGLPHEYLVQETLCRSSWCPYSAHKGIDQRNRALQFIEQNNLRGVVYFADDDNAYDTRLFEALREVRRVGVFAVGLVGRAGYEAPIVRAGRVVDFASHTPLWPINERRRFRVDMAGFAFASSHAQQERPRFDRRSFPGFLENDFLRYLADDLDDLEPLLSACSRVLVWHNAKLPGSFDDPVVVYPQNWSLQAIAV
jgi:hypothetical protein